MNVANSSWWKIVVNNNVYAFEIDSSSHQISTDKNPDLPQN